MRTKKKIKRKIEPDTVYTNMNVTKLIHYVMKDGKKSIAEKIVYAALTSVSEKTGKDPMEVFEAALVNTSPYLEVRPRRIGGATYQVPIEVRGDRKLSLSFRWLLEGAHARKGVPMHQRLALELIDASQNQGKAVQRKENTHRMAEANKAFARFAW